MNKKDLVERLFNVLFVRNYADILDEQVKIDIRMSFEDSLGSYFMYKYNVTELARFSNKSFRYLGTLNFEPCIIRSITHLSHSSQIEPLVDLFTCGREKKTLQGYSHNVVIKSLDDELLKEEVDVRDIATINDFERWATIATPFRDDSLATPEHSALCHFTDDVWSCVVNNIPVKEWKFVVSLGNDEVKILTLNDMWGMFM